MTSEQQRESARPIRTGGYASLRSYAVLGDMRGSALVAGDGAIDWLALPVMDSPPLCAALLDPAAGGSVELTPTIPFKVERRYLAGTMALETKFITEAGSVRVTDSLNRGAARELPWAELARRIDVDEGEVPMRWSVRPGHGLAGLRPWFYLAAGQPRILVGDRLLAVITDGLGEPVLDSHGVGGRFAAQAARPGLLAVVASERRPLHVPHAREIAARIDATEAVWRRWSEQVGGERNFDYRFAWIRDASFAIDAMNRLGLSEEVHASISWLLDTVMNAAPDLRVFYAPDGSVVPAEMRAANAPGYRGSQPVKVGNGAADQMQLGCFGDLLDAVLRYVEAGGALAADTATFVGTLADRVCELWRASDAGLWELGDPKPYTISKIGCWVALDRALRLVDAGQLTSLRVDRWRSERDQIRSWTEANCWSETTRAYIFYAGTDELDAAVLLAARTGYCDGRDPRLHTTIDAIATELGAGEALLDRYSGQADKEGACLACSCWMVEALSDAGRLDEATRWLEGSSVMPTTSASTPRRWTRSAGTSWATSPRRWSHLALIGAATAIQRAGG